MKKMIQKLKNILNNSYSPYSKFKVSAILQTEDGQEFIGVNVENKDFKNGLCAEQVAISSAITSGYKPQQFKTLYIMTQSEKISTPCFLCRQWISELFSNQTKIICTNIKGQQKEYTVNQLCPYTFGEEDIKRKIRRVKK